MDDRKPLVPRNPDGVLRVILLTRSSTSGQSTESMDSSRDVCERWVRERFAGEIEFRYRAEQASGWELDRTTMIEAKAIIASGEWDLVVVGELCELCRKPAFLWAFLYACVDAGVRVIVIEDQLDTANDNWETLAKVRTLVV